MDANAFYELRTRLYAVAATGCGLIKEDFRLKRALEAFETMSKANKVFGHLYQMCEKLFDIENAAEELVDCIALAEALAVAQGSFLEQPECTEETYQLSLKPQTISNKYLKEVKSALLKGKINFQHDVQLMLEPRVFPSFIQSLQQETDVTGSLADVLLPQFGAAILPILKGQIDLETDSAKNKTASYIRLIRHLFGYQENEWYLSLIEEDAYPKSIRVGAVYALGCSEKNIPKLLELYKTQKGVVKTAVIFVLAKLNPPEAEDIWKKFIGKYKDSYKEYIIHSNSDICAEFARKAVFEAVEKCQKRYDNESVNFAVDMIQRKPQLEDCFLILAENYKYIEKKHSAGYRHRRVELNQILIKNLWEEDPRYVDMVKNLYHAQKEFYFPARFVLALKEIGERAFEEFQEELYANRNIMLWMFRNIRYDSVMQEYYLPWCCLQGAPLSELEKGWYPALKIFGQIPETLLSFVADTSYFVPQKRDRKTTVQPIKNQRTYPAEIKESIRVSIEVFGIWCDLSFIGSPEHKKCIDIAVKFAFEVNQYCSIGGEIRDIILKYNRSKTPEEYKGILTNYSIQNALSGESFGWSMQNMLREIPMSDEDKKSELLEIKAILEQMTNMSEKNKKEMISDINRFLRVMFPS